jgi:hypothetical protein
LRGSGASGAEGELKHQRKAHNMKKLLILIVMTLWTTDLLAVKLCGKSSSFTWRSNTRLDSPTGTIVYEYQTNASDEPPEGAWWTITTLRPFNITVSGEVICATNSTSRPPIPNAQNVGACMCRITSITDNTNNLTCDVDSADAPWAYAHGFGVSLDSNCRRDCWRRCVDYCFFSGTHPVNSFYTCTRSKLLEFPGCDWLDESTSTAPTASAVTCPINGTCENPDYKTVADNESCGDGFVETTTPALTISGEYEDATGATFTYGNCTAN